MQDRTLPVVRVIEGGTEMQSTIKLLVTLAVLAMSLSLGGCFHHRQVETEAVMPPPSTPPLK
jgi:hypothetical protein